MFMNYFVWDGDDSDDGDDDVPSLFCCVWVRLFCGWLAVGWDDHYTIYSTIFSVLSESPDDVSDEADGRLWDGPLKKNAVSAE